MIDDMLELDMTRCGLPSIVKCVMTAQAVKAERIARLYDLCNDRGETLKPRAIVFQSLEINGFAGDVDGGTSVFGLTRGTYLWCLELSAQLNHIDLETSGVGTSNVVASIRGLRYTIAADRCSRIASSIIVEIRKTEKTRSVFSVFLEITWAIWLHELAHVISGHTKIIQEDGSSRWLREFGNDAPTTKLFHVSGRKLLEAEADCRAASMHTAMTINLHCKNPDFLMAIKQSLAHYFLGIIIFFSILFISRGLFFVSEAEYPSPMARVVYALTMAAITLDLNGLDSGLAVSAIQEAFFLLQPLKESFPEIASVEKAFNAELMAHLKGEVWDIGTEMRKQRLGLGKFMFGSSTEEVVPNPFD